MKRSKLVAYETFRGTRSNPKVPSHSLSISELNAYLADYWDMATDGDTDPELSAPHVTSGYRQLGLHSSAYRLTHIAYAQSA
jgi:hypothetical protein